MGFLIGAVILIVVCGLIKPVKNLLKDEAELNRTKREHEEELRYLREKAEFEKEFGKK